MINGFGGKAEQIFMENLRKGKIRLRNTALRKHVERMFDKSGCASFNSLISYFSIDISSKTNKRLDDKQGVFQDSDTLFEYLINEEKMDSEDAYEITQDVSYGLFDMDHKNEHALPLDIYRAATKINHLLPRTVSARYMFYYIMVYFDPKPLDFIEKL